MQCNNPVGNLSSARRLCNVHYDMNDVVLGSGQFYSALMSSQLF